MYFKIQIKLYLKKNLLQMQHKYNTPKLTKFRI